MVVLAGLLLWHLPDLVPGVGGRDLKLLFKCPFCFAHLFMPCSRLFGDCNSFSAFIILLAPYIFEKEPSGTGSRSCRFLRLEKAGVLLKRNSQNVGCLAETSRRFLF